MTNTQFHGWEAKRARRNRRVARRRMAEVLHVARLIGRATETTDARRNPPSLLRPAPPAEPFNVAELPAAPVETNPAPANVDNRPEVSPPAIEPAEVPVTIGAPEFGCVYPGCGRTFKTRQALSGHQRAHKTGKLSAE